MSEPERREYCCGMMLNAVEGWRKDCKHHEHAHECPDALISVFPGGEHGIIVHDGGNSHVVIEYCPWCGVSVEAPRPLEPFTQISDDGELEVHYSGPMPEFLRNPNPPSPEAIAEADRKMAEFFGTDRREDRP